MFNEKSSNKRTKWMSFRFFLSWKDWEFLLFSPFHFQTIESHFSWQWIDCDVKFSTLIRSFFYLFPSFSSGHWTDVIHRNVIHPNWIEKADTDCFIDENSLWWQDDRLTVMSHWLLLKFGYWSWWTFFFSGKRLKIDFAKSRHHTRAHQKCRWQKSVTRARMCYFCDLSITFLFFFIVFGCSFWWVAHCIDTPSRWHVPNNWFFMKFTWLWFDTCVYYSFGFSVCVKMWLLLCVWGGNQVLCLYWNRKKKNVICSHSI